VSNHSTGENSKHILSGRFLIGAQAVGQRPTEPAAFSLKADTSTRFKRNRRARRISFSMEHVMADNPVLDTAKFAWDLIKDGGKLTSSNTTVNVLPQGTGMQDIGGWQGPASYSEKYEQLSAIFESSLADFTLTASWQYNGQYIGNFHVVADGTVDVLSSVDVSVQTYEGTYDDGGVAQLPYDIQVQFHNLTGGTQRVTYSEMARGDGGGMCVGVA
jgi:hypothetical protein